MERFKITRKKDGDTDTDLATDTEMDSDEVFTDSTTEDKDTRATRERAEERENPFRRGLATRRTPPKERITSLSEERRKEAYQMDPFKRRDSIGRSPVRVGGKHITERSLSKTGTDGRKDKDDTNPQRKESKKDEEPETGKGTAKRQRENSEEDLKELKQMFTRLENDINNLTKEVHQNTRVGIKKGIKLAKVHADEIARKWDVLTLQLREGKKSKRMEEEDDEVIVVEELKTVPKEMRSIATQASEDTIRKEVGQEENTESRKIQEQLGRKEGWRGCEPLLDQNWPERAFVNTSIHKDVGKLNAEEVDIVVIVDPKVGVEGKALEKVRDGFPDLEGLIAEGANGMEYIRKKIRTERSRGGGLEKTSTLYVLPLETGCSGENITKTERLYNLLEEMAAKVLESGREKIKVIPHEGVHDQYIRKCTEAVLAGTKIKGEIVASKNLNIRMEGKEKKTKNKRLMQTPGSKVIVKMRGRNYADTLKQVKEKINPDEMNIRINKVKRTARGDLMLEVDGGVDNANKLKGEIEKGMEEGSTTVEHVKASTHMMIWGIEPDTLEEDILKALEEKVGRPTHGNMKITSLRPTKGGNLAATVSISKKLIKEALRNGTVRIGWSLCRMRERVNIIRCYRCLEFGHRTKECSGEDRANQCLNCGKDNHKVKDCGNVSFCNTCKTEGHRADQMTCPVFRKMVNRTTEEGRRGTRKTHAEREAIAGRPQTERQ